MGTEKQFIVRRAVPEDYTGIGKVHVDAWRETYAGILPAELLDALSYERRSQYWHQVLSDPMSGTELFVLERAGEGIKGFVSVGPERGEIAGYDGEIYAIYLLREAQGQGYGRQLFDRGAEALGRSGYRSMALWVLQENKTRGFYQHLGGVIVGEKPVEFGGREFVELAYGWPRLDEFLTGSTGSGQD